MFRLILVLIFLPTILLSQIDQSNYCAGSFNTGQLMEASINIYSTQQMHIGYDFYYSNSDQFSILVENEVSWLNNLTNTPIHILMVQDAIELSIADNDEDYTRLILHFTNNHNMDLLAKEISMINGVWLVEVSPNKES